MPTCTRVAHFALERTTFIPEHSGMLEGSLYCSEPYGVASHRCACGCGLEVVTPLGEGGWTLTADADGPTLSPSIGNFQQPCRSHYWIRNGAVVWA